MLDLCRLMLDSCWNYAEMYAGLMLDSCWTIAELTICWTRTGLILDSGWTSAGRALGSRRTRVCRRWTHFSQCGQRANTQCRRVMSSADCDVGLGRRSKHPTQSGPDNHQDRPQHHAARLHCLHLANKISQVVFLDPSAVRDRSIINLPSMTAEHLLGEDHAVMLQN